MAVEAIQALMVRLHGSVGQLIGADLDESSRDSPRRSRHDVIAANISARHHSANMFVHRNDLSVRKGVAAVDSPRLQSRRIAWTDGEIWVGLDVIAGRPRKRHVLQVEWHICAS